MWFQRGLTLIELMVTLAIVAIFVMFVVPSFNSLMASYRLMSMRDSMVNAVYFAKAEAVSRKGTVALCPSSDGTTCLNSNQWNQGWIAFLDRGTAGWDSGDEIIRVWEGRGRVLLGAVDLAKTISFIPQGIATSGAGQTIGFCDPDGTVGGRSLVIGSTTGQVRTGSEAEAGCGGEA